MPSSTRDRGFSVRLYELYSVDVQRAFHLGDPFGGGEAEPERFGREVVGAMRAGSRGRRP
jgi:hypothetical protein